MVFLLWKYWSLLWWMVCIGLELVGGHNKYFDWCRGRLTNKRSLLPFAHVDESTDSLRGGVTQDGVQHSLGEHANHSLALASVFGRQNMTNLLKQFNHNTLKKKQRWRWACIMSSSQPEVLSGGLLESAYMCLCGTMRHFVRSRAHVSLHLMSMTYLSPFFRQQVL